MDLGEDLAVSGLRDAVMRERPRGGVEDAFEGLREEARREVGGAAERKGWIARARAFVASHPRAILLFLACAAVFVVLSRVVGGLGFAETALGAVLVGAVGVGADWKFFRGTGPA